MPTISAGALKRMLGLPANVVTGVPRIEKDPRGGGVVIVPVRPYAKDMDRCARCGERGRPLFCFNVCSTGSAVFFRSVG